MINRSGRSQQKLLNISGSSTFGRYPKISVEKSVNFFLSDEFIVPYSGYMKAIDNAIGSPGQSGKGRGAFNSTKLDRIVAVVGNGVYIINIFYDTDIERSYDYSVLQAGTLNTESGKVYITSNNVPQIIISDGQAIYVYDPSASTKFYQATGDGASPSTTPLGFTPGYVDFHDNYVLAAASNDKTASPGSTLNNTWRLSEINDSTGQLYFPADAAHVGYLQTKPDDTQAVIRFPSRGNVILVIGRTVAEVWMDVGYQLFPYQRSNASNYDYGCLNPATIASNDQIVAWLAQNEQTGPIIVYTEGGVPEKITTDGIDYLLSQLSDPSDSEAFLYRQDGHLFYHINFYTDNLSLFYDFNTKKFFHATDEKGNYFIASSVIFFNNQYYFVTRNDGFLYAMDTIYTTYDGKQIPRLRVCKPVRLATQEYFVSTDCGFTIEQGTTNPVQQSIGFPFLITQDGYQISTQGGTLYLATQDGQVIGTQDGNALTLQQPDPNDTSLLIANNESYITTYPRVDLSISIDGGYSFSSWMPYNMNALAHRKNRLMWWQLGLANDLTCQFSFSGFGRFVATDGIVNIRQ